MLFRPFLDDPCYWTGRLCATLDDVDPSQVKVLGLGNESNTDNSVYPASA